VRLTLTMLLALILKPKAPLRQRRLADARPCACDDEDQNRVKLAALHPDATQQDACDRACEHEEISHQGKDVSAETDKHIIQ
jgi:hypothetical protein